MSEQDSELALDILEEGPEVELSFRRKSDGTDEVTFDGFVMNQLGASNSDLSTAASEGFAPSPEATRLASPSPSDASSGGGTYLLLLRELLQPTPSDPSGDAGAGPGTHQRLLRDNLQPTSCDSSERASCCSGTTEGEPESVVAAVRGAGPGIVESVPESVVAALFGSDPDAASEDAGSPRAPCAPAEGEDPGPAVVAGAISILRHRGPSGALPGCRAGDAEAEVLRALHAQDDSTSATRAALFGASTLRAQTPASVEQEFATLFTDMEAPFSEAAATQPPPTEPDTCPSGAPGSICHCPPVRPSAGGGLPGPPAAEGVVRPPERQGTRFIRRRQYTKEASICLEA